MSKKLIAACMVIAAFAAFGMVSTASAAPVITYPTGTVLASGTLLKATNITEMAFTSSSINVRCPSVTTTGAVKSNSTAGGFSGEAQSITISGTGSAGDCTATGSFFTGSAKPTPEIAGGLPWCFKNTLNDNLEIRGGACSEAARSIKFGIDLTGLTTCVYERTSLTGTFGTDVSGQDATGSITAGLAWTLVSGFGCPSGPTLDIDFTEETDTTTASPVYISS
jgi:hypothetical protein